MAGSNDSANSDAEGTGVVCIWNGKEVGVRYRLDSVPDEFPDDRGGAAESSPDTGRFAGTLTTVTRYRLLLSPAILSLESGRNLEITIHQKNGLTDEYRFVTSAHWPVG